MQYLESLTKQQLTSQIQSDGIALKIGPFNFSIASDHSALVDFIGKLYGSYPLLDDSEFIDFNIRLLRASGLRRYFSPQVNFYLDDFSPFKPLGLGEARAMLEWGMNWCVGAHAHQYLIIHSAVVAKGDTLVILPGKPGAGKSTLCAALVGEGWRLFSDELALVDTNTLQVHPVVRPISLKNKSIDVITERYPQFEAASRIQTSSKGIVSHFPAPKESLALMSQPLAATHMVFPQFDSSAQCEISQVGQGEAMLSVIDDCFNYNPLGKKGFETLSHLMASIECYSLHYGDLDTALSFMESLVSNECIESD